MSIEKYVSRRKAFFWVGNDAIITKIRKNTTVGYLPGGEEISDFSRVGTEYSFDDFICMRAPVLLKDEDLTEFVRFVIVLRHKPRNFVGLPQKEALLKMPVFRKAPSKDPEKGLLLSTCSAGCCGKYALTGWGPI